MAVVTFFNRWLRVKLGMEKSDWPEYSENGPEPYSDEEVVALESYTRGKINCQRDFASQNKIGHVDGHLLCKLQKVVKKSGVANVKLHRFRDTFILYNPVKKIPLAVISGTDPANYSPPWRLSLTADPSILTAV
jgi:hypothetical protein